MSVTPDFVGQIYKDTTTGNLWRANSLAAGDWTLELQNHIQLTPPGFDVTEALWIGSYNGATGLTGIVFPNAINVSESIDLEGLATITSISFPKLVSNSIGSTIIISGSATLSSLGFPSLTTLNDELHIENCTALASLSFPSLTSIAGAGGGIWGSGCTSLSDVDLGTLIIDNNNSISFDGCALTAASVNHILARGVASASFNTGNIDTSGGTSAAPSGQGVADKATLLGRGVTVTTN